jgi:excisionase family DNA binding protein
MSILDTDHEQWLTKQQAADQLGVTTKTVEAYAREHRMRCVPNYKRQTGGARITIFHPEDVKTLADARHSGTVPDAVLPAPPLTVGRVVSVSGPSPSVEIERAPLAYLPPPSTTAAFIEALTAVLEKSQNSRKSEISEISQKFYLTIPEAARLSGFTETRIRRLCHEGSLKALKDGGWKIKRADLLAL